MNIIGKIRAQAKTHLRSMGVDMPVVHNREHQHIWCMVLGRSGQAPEAMDEEFIVQSAGSGHVICYALQDADDGLLEVEDLSETSDEVTLYAWNPAFYCKKVPKNVTVRHIRSVFH